MHMYVRTHDARARTCEHFITPDWPLHPTHQKQKLGLHFFDLKVDHSPLFYLNYLDFFFPWGGGRRAVWFLNLYRCWWGSRGELYANFVGKSRVFWAEIGGGEGGEGMMLWLSIWSRLECPAPTMRGATLPSGKNLWGGRVGYGQCWPLSVLVGSFFFRNDIFEKLEVSAEKKNWLTNKKVGICFFFFLKIG